MHIRSLLIALFFAKLFATKETSINRFRVKSLGTTRKISFLKGQKEKSDTNLIWFTIAVKRYYFSVQKAYTKYVKQADARGFNYSGHCFQICIECHPNKTHILSK